MLRVGVGERTGRAPVFLNQRGPVRESIGELTKGRRRGNSPLQTGIDHLGFLMGLMYGLLNQVKRLISKNRLTLHTWPHAGYSLVGLIAY